MKNPEQEDETVMLEKQLPYKHKVYEVIKEEILCGRYAPGDTLNERRLSEELGISRTPVREGLQMLAQEGWLQMETYKGAVVREFELEYLRDVAQIRSVLESCAAENAARNITDEGIQQLEENQKAQQDSLSKFDVYDYMLLDRKFHTTISNYSGNKELIHLLQNYYDMYRYLGTQAVMNKEERRWTTLAEHQAVLDALKSHDPQKAVRAMNAHMKSTMENTDQYMRTHLANRSGKATD